MRNTRQCDTYRRLETWPYTIRCRRISGHTDQVTIEDIHNDGDTRPAGHGEHVDINGVVWTAPDEQPVG